ncbi:MAG: DEAD/DEAH box helicase [Patescibacteria group bacterium]
MYTGSQRAHNPYIRGRFSGNTNRKFIHRGKRNRLAEKIEESRFVSNTSFISAPVYKPNHSFADFPFSEKLKANIAYQKYNVPTAIQDQSIPHILAGRDLIGIANTGTGKTAAFLLPLIDKVSKNPTERALVVAPTRELAVQIKGELQKFAYGLGIYAVLCIGGVSLSAQKNELRRNPHFVIGTPGRLKDLIRGKSLDLSRFHNVVLDEVDRMVDIGFVHDIKYFISLLPQNRQSLFFSATIPAVAKDILRTFVKDPISASVKKQDTPANITQTIVRVKDKGRKVEQLQELLRQKGFDKVIVFGRTKWGIQKLTARLINSGFKAAAIHGNKSQNQRQRALGEFKKNKIQILLATDVASRGLDIQDVTHVINYDQPASYDDYVHRIGRTGRIDKKGSALTFVE